MLKKEIIKAIRKAKYVDAVVHLTEHDSFHIQVVKKDLISTILKAEKDWAGKLNEPFEWKAQICEDTLIIG